MQTELERSTSFGERLKRLRRQLDLTQEGLAELASCSVQTIRFFESGRRRPSVEMAEHLATLLNVPADERTQFIQLARNSLLTDAPAPPVAPAPMATDSLPALTPHRPPAFTILIGRAGELNALHHLLLVEQARLVTVLGAGGMGKTQLALTTANSVVDAFPDGVVFVSLAPLQHAHQLPSAVADALGLTLQGARDTQEQLLAYLAPRQLLLVLDNFEHLLGEGNEQSTHWVNEWLRLPGLQLLVTSRERLRLSGERSFELGGLTLPAATAELQQAAAVLLFLARAQQIDGNFILNAENQAAVSLICQLVDGMPLALELAATWVRMLRCQEIAEELQRSIDFLVLADRDMPTRHHSMRAVLDHSWALLTVAEQRVLAAMSVFRGGCSRAAARAVADATLPILAALIDKSLVRRMGEGSEQARYDLHELTRQYAAQQLALDGEQAHVVHVRHATYFAGLAAMQQVTTAGVQQMAVLAQLEQELDNIRSAWHFALDAGRYTLVQQMINRLGETFLWRSRYHEGLALFQATANTLAAQPLSQPNAAEVAYLTCEVMIWVGCFYLQIGQVPGGEAFFTDLQLRLTTLAATGYDVLPAQAMLLSEYALFLFITVGNYERASALQQKCVALYRRHGTAHYLAKNLVRLSQIMHFTGNYIEAIALVEEAIAIGRRHGDQLVLIGAMERLALTLTYQGHFAEAEPHFRAALASAEATRQPAKTSSVLTNLGVVLTFCGRFHDGHAAWQRALGLSTAVGDHNYMVHNTILLGFAALHLGNDAEAIARSQEGLALAARLGYVRDGALGQLLLASAQLVQGKLTAADASINTAIARYRTIAHPDELSWAMAVQLYVLRAQGQPQLARQLVSETVQLVQQTGGFNAVQTVLPILALLAFDEGAVALALPLIVALRQSAFVQQSTWFTQVAGAELAQLVTTLPPDMQASLAAQIAAGTRLPDQELLNQASAYFAADL